MQIGHGGTVQERKRGGKAASKINARARRCLNLERASVDNEARGTSGRDFDSSRPSLGYLSAGLILSLVLGAFWRHSFSLIVVWCVEWNIFIIISVCSVVACFVAHVSCILQLLSLPAPISIFMNLNSFNVLPDFLLPTSLNMISLISILDLIPRYLCPPSALDSRSHPSPGTIPVEDNIPAHP